MRLGLIRGMLGLGHTLNVPWLKMLRNIAEAVSKVVGLQDPETEDHEMHSDRVGVGGSYNFTSVDQALVTAARMGSRQPELLPANLDIPASLDTIGERFYLIYGNDWNHNQVYLDKLIEIDIFHEMVQSEFAMQGNLKSHRYMQAGVDVIIQANSQQFQLGCLLCMLVPGWSDGISYSGFGMVPHGFINLNINNSCRLQAPWVYTRGAYNITTPIQAPWRLVVVILTELRTTSGAATSCTVSVMARFTDMKLHGIHPIGMMGPTEVRISSTVNVVNMSNANGASAKVSFALGDESYLGDDSVTGGLYVDNFRTWASTPGFIGRFAFNGSALIGDKLAVFPVNPFFYSVRDSSNHWHPPPATSIAQMYAFWRGDIVYYFQVVASRFHNGRMMFCFVPGTEALNVSSLNIKKASSSMCAIMDIQGTSSTCCFRVPYTSDKQYKSNVSQETRQNTTYGTNWLSTSIGKLVVFCYNKLRFPNTVLGNVWVNVYMCVENAEFMCPMYVNLGGTTTIPTSREIELESCAGDEAEEKFEQTGAFSTPGVVDQNKTKQDFYVDKPMNKIPVGAVMSIEEPTMEVAKPMTFQERAPGKKRHTIDHLDMYEFMGRGHLFFTFTFNAPSSGAKKALTVPLDIRRRNSAGKGLGGVLQWFYSLFHLYQGPVDITLVFSGSVDVDMMIWYTPDGYLTSATWDQQSAGQVNLTPDYVSGYPFIRCNTRETGNVQIRIPWYTCLSAISACVTDACPDTSLGYISIYINNYTSQDERLGISAYWSIPREAKMSVPRPNLRQNLIYASSSGGLGYSVDNLPMGMVETSVDFVNDCDPLPDVKPAKRVLVPVDRSLYGPMGNVYKDLRIQVGAHRLVYAHEELKRSKSEEQLQSNAGEIFDDYGIVQLRDGDIIYRGICLQGKIYYAKCVNIPLRKAPLLKSGCIVCVEQDSSWLSLNNKVDAAVFDKFVASLDGDLKFNWKAYENGDYVGALGQDVFLRLDTSCDGGLNTILSVMSGKSLGMLDKVIQDSQLFEMLTETNKDVRSVVKECEGLIQDVRDAIANFSKFVSPKKYYIISKMLMLLVKSSIKIYVCVKSEWNPSIFGPIFLDLALDVGSTSVDMTVLVKNLLHEIATQFGAKEVESQSLSWVRDAVGCVSLFKSARDCLNWLIAKFRDWYNVKYGSLKQKVDSIMEAQEQIESLVAYVDDYCTRPQVTSDEVAEGREVLVQLRSLMSFIAGEPELKSFSTELRSAVHLLHNKLRNVPADNTASCMRDEPTVLYLHGPRGCGKSLLAMAVATKICKQKGLDPKKHIYTKAPVSEYWDGYAGQEVCIVDDIGQATDDADWTYFCQIVSCCPVRLNMPALDQKGIHFTTPYIICTSNLSDPEPRTIYTKEALARRLHVKIKVTPARYYQTNQNGITVLDVHKAMQHDAIRDLSCLKLMDEGLKELSFDELVQRYVSAAQNKVQLMHEFMDLWSQSGCDSLSQWFQLKNVSPTTKSLSIFRTLKDHKVLLIGASLSILVAAGAIYSAYRFIKKPDTAGAYVGVKQVKNVIRLGEEVQSQSVVDLANVVEKNLMRFGISKDGELVSWRVNALQVFDTWCIVPRHAFRFDKDVTHFFFCKNGTTYVVRKDRVVEVQSENCPDLVYLNVPGMPKGKNIIDHFVKLGDVPACNGRLATLATVNQGVFQIMSEGDVEYKDGMTYNHSSESGKEKIYIPKVWKGKGEISGGSCGGVLISSNNRLGNPFIGIHLAAGGGMLVSALVTREDLQQLQGVLPNSNRITQCVPSTEVVSTGSRTAFIRSEIYDHIPEPCTKSPSSLFHSKCEVDVAAKMFQKYAFPVLREPEGFNNCALAVLDRILDVYGMPKRVELSEREAIEGIEGMDAIPMDTSPGIPYVNRQLRKSDLIKDGRVVHWLARQRIEMHMNDMSFGIPCDVTFMTCAKDELRKIEKVVNGDTRMIEASPVCFNICFRRVFGHAVAWLQSHPGWSTGIGVGVNPDFHWNEIFADALRFGDYAICIDYRSFDATIQDYMIEWAVWILGYLVVASDDVVRSVSRTLSYSRRQVGGMIYYVRGSLPSGAPATSVLNSLMNLSILTFAFSRTLGVSPFDLWRVVRFLVYGDDVMVVWNRNYNIDALSLQTLHARFGDLGMIVTGPDKGPVKICGVLDCVFLKRGVRVGPIGIFQPTMDLTTIVSLLQWRRRGATLEENIINSLGFAFHHGRAVFDHYRGMVMDALRAIGRDAVLPDYQHFEARFISLHFNI
uniref:Genome polyprotein n=1 Tax=bar-headed goose hepatovirus TaxID=3155981 RepID=A0AAU7B9C1_9PICO